MKTRRRSALTHSLAGLALCTLAVGCHSNNNSPGIDAGPPVVDGGTDGGATIDGGTDGGALGTGTPTTTTVIANGAQPFDSAPSPDGTQVYFTGTDSAQGAAVFKVPAAGGATTLVASGINCGTTSTCIGVPFGVAVSTDGTTVFAADPAFRGASANDNGAIFKVPAVGGEPAALAETVDYAPYAVTVTKVGTADNIYFIGQDPTASGAPGIFMDAASKVTPVIEGAAANDPQAVAVASDGTVYFVDGNGAVQKVLAGKATPLVAGAKNLIVSFPAGIAVSQDNKAVLVPDTDPATSAPGIARIDVATGAVTQLALTPALVALNSSGGGLHRAANADIYSFVDTGAGTGPASQSFSTGTIYLLK